jgi:hypothetical protein
MQRIIGTIGIIVLGALFIYFSAILFIGIAVVGVIGYGLYFARDFLVEKGILNPSPGVTAAPEEEITIIDGDFKTIENDEAPKA